LNRLGQLKLTTPNKVEERKMIEIIQLDRDKDEHKRTKNIGKIRKQTTTRIN